MLVRNTRILLVVVFAGAVGVVHFWTDSDWRGRISAQFPSSGAKDTTARERSHVAPPSFNDAAERRLTAVSGAMRPSPEHLRPASVARARLHVVAPTDVQVGNVFEARIQMDASGGMHDLSLAVTYDNRRLALVGWSRGALAQGGAVASELAVQEPSEGNIDVGFSLGNGQFMSGTGSIVVLRFEAIKPGTSPIRLENVAITDKPGAKERSSASVVQGVIAIH